jgi:hypothetical protein
VDGFAAFAIIAFDFDFSRFRFRLLAFPLFDRLSLGAKPGS